jgi:tetratricopeptide (TPR) repeat protein
VMTRLHIAQGDLDQAQSLHENLGDFRRLSEQYGFMPPFWSSVALARGEWALATGDTADALAYAKDYLALLESRGVRLYLPQAHHMIAAAELAGGNVEGALEALQRGLAEAETMGARRPLLDLLILQTLAFTQADLLDAADEARTRAKQIAKTLGDKIENEALQEAFFARTEEKMSAP